MLHYFRWLLVFGKTKCKIRAKPHIAAMRQATNATKREDSSRFHASNLSRRLVHSPSSSIFDAAKHIPTVANQIDAIRTNIPCANLMRNPLVSRHSYRTQFRRAPSVQGPSPRNRTRPAFVRALGSCDQKLLPGRVSRRMPQALRRYFSPDGSALKPSTRLTTRPSLTNSTTQRMPSQTRSSS